MQRRTLTTGRALAAAVLAAGLGAGHAAAQDGAGARYLTPPAPIPQILDAAPTPGVSVSADGRTIALLSRENMPAIAELAEPELHLAGIRMNPRINGPAPSRVTWITGIAFQDVATGAKRRLALPAASRLAFTRWSPDGRRMAFVSATRTGLELWVAEVATGLAHRVTPGDVNAAFGQAPYDWMPDSRSLIVARIPAGRGAVPAASAVPAGPLVEENAGRPTPAPTYEDLLKTPQDERLFEHYFTSRLYRVPAAGGVAAALGTPGIHVGVDPSPDGRYLLVTRLKKPFSYHVTANRFPTEVLVLDAQGTTVRRVADLPLAEDLPIAFDAVRTGPRAVEWRSDAPATLTWVEAQDRGNPAVQAAVRDRVFVLDAPFTGTPATLIDLEHRFSGIDWARGDFAMVTSRWWNTRWEKRFAVDPSHPGAAPRLLSDRSYDDRYGAPGDAVTQPNASGHPVMVMTADGRGVYLSGEGASRRGNYPFLDRMEVATGRMERLWQAKDPYYETVVAVLSPDAGRVLTRRESQTEAPNYFLRSLPGDDARKLTDFADPAPQFAGVQRQLITYPRKDGVTLSATLYLPAGYDARRDGPLPMFMWAYPREFRDAAAASQVSDSPNRFTRPSGASHLFLLTQGYAVLDGPAMPIIGANGAEPNDTYVEQLVASAQAAVEKVVEMGVADRDRIGVGGHSYGAFMTANLLAHSDLFRAGIARSGAYNRTLTPFGFQAEQRTYWGATDIYTKMSPFTYANQIHAPILLIHGANDDNTGTFPVQSERMYAALKGNGATVRYVVLPYETHGYRARESVMHTLAEMTTWMDRYVKHAAPRLSPPAPPAAAASTTIAPAAAATSH
ncbi:MAG: aminoacyl peptidase [Gemmatimonadetes bacterium]|nr:aminoacyl peptidase [Gemmatimonadota bacterium]